MSSIREGFDSLGEPGVTAFDGKHWATGWGTPILNNDLGQQNRHTSK